MYVLTNNLSMWCLRTDELMIKHAINKVNKRNVINKRLTKNSKNKLDKIAI